MLSGHRAVLLGVLLAAVSWGTPAVAEVDGERVVVPGDQAAHVAPRPAPELAPDSSAATGDAFDSRASRYSLERVKKFQAALAQFPRAREEERSLLLAMIGLVAGELSSVKPQAATPQKEACHGSGCSEAPAATAGIEGTSRYRDDAVVHVVDVGAGTAFIGEGIRQALRQTGQQQTVRITCVENANVWRQATEEG